MQNKTTTLDGFELEYRLAPHMVVFSHGFGVRRDSRGMFTDISQHLPADFGYVLFDYDNIDGEMLRATYAAEQIVRLQRVVAWARQQPGVENVGIVAHSRGCLITSLARIQSLSFVVMLAPPLAQGHARHYFTNKPGTIKRGDDWHVPRSDGTTTIIPEGVFVEFDQVQREAVLLDYAVVQPMFVVVAGADGVLGEQDYGHLEANPNITLQTIAGASHDFADAARQPLIHLVSKYLNERR